MNEFKDIVLDGTVMRINGKEYPLEILESINLTFSPGTVSVDVKCHETMKVGRKCEL